MGGVMAEPWTWMSTIKNAMMNFMTSSPEMIFFGCMFLYN